MKTGHESVTLEAARRAEQLLRELDTMRLEDRFDVVRDTLIGILERERETALMHAMDAMTLTREQVTKWHCWHLFGALFFGFFVGVFGFSWIWR